MRMIRNVVPIAIATGFFALSLLCVGPAAMAVGPDTDQSTGDGKVVGMTGTTVQIKEWAGTYTYRLSPTGLQALDAARIQPGDDVRFTVSKPWGMAFDFALLKRGPSPASFRGSKGLGRLHVVVSPLTRSQVVGG